MATVTIDLTCNLQQAVQVQYLNGNMFSADNAGNTINVYVMDGEEPATIGGSVSASVIRADGSTVAVSGALEGNKAYVILPQACYAVPGVISIVIKNTQNSTVTTIAALVANVYQSSTDVVVDPGTIIPSVQNLIAAIETAVGSIPADYSSLWTSLAPAFSTSTAYTVGQYVTNNGGLYRFIADHAAGTWNSAQVVAANLGNDISALKSALVIEKEVTPTWESGTINTNGVNQNSTTRIRSNMHIFTGGFTATIPSGMKMSTRVYKLDGTYESWGDWKTGTARFELSESKRYRFVAAYTDDSTIAATAGSGIEIKEDKYTDPSLTMSEKAADAKATGDAIGNVETEAGILFDVLSQAKGITKFIQGSIATNNGTNVSSTTRIRSSGYQNFESDMVEISVAEGYKFSIREYSSPSLVPAEIQSSFIQALPSVNGWCTDKYTLYNTFGKYYRFVVAKSDESAITPSDATSANLVASALKKPNEVSAYSVAGNNLLGNVSIRAAKTIMFNDGTPPVIDWYLLQDVNNNFYRSKDLTDKQYLFTFEAPTSTTSNWSCGIDGNNNIFFVKDAAGYTDDDGPRLDDAKRENPIFFKAEDNYTSQNELDFGEGFKPAGWLMNIGWCVLPNGDVIFCEYTRGILKTCNVWHIDGADTTDPENWTVTWSHDIIDSTSATALGMKHCHTVQYDFYTGICYFSTGDSSDGSFIYHSLDNGETWELTYGPNRDRCRQLTFVFTADKVYWASDNYNAEDHNFFIADRDENGVVDVENARKVVIGLVNNQACYGCVYLQSLGFIAFMDRNDTGGYDKFIFKGYDIANDEIVTIGEWGMVGGGLAGFRTKYTEWYPTGASIRTGFNPKSGSVTPDTNYNALCGNLGGSSGDGSTRVNNLILHIGRDANGAYSVRASSIYV